MTEALFAKLILFSFLGVVLIVLARNGYGKRHWIALNVFKFIIFFLAMLGVMALAKAVRIHGWWVQYIAMALATPLFFGWDWKRARKPPVEMRRKVILKWEARTGKVYDPKLYEVDHKVAFARHGSHTMDNLRVIRRDANRRKGHRELGLREWIQIWRRKDED